MCQFFKHAVPKFLKHLLVVTIFVALVLKGQRAWMRAKKDVLYNLSTDTPLVWCLCVFFSLCVFGSGSG